jgi:hypothetical protein
MTVRNPHREEHDVFEARFQIAALVESNKQGQPVFKVTQQGEPANDEQLLSLMMTIYQQTVSPTLQAGDTLTVTVHLDLPPREIERTVRLREDERFEGEGLQEPTADLGPLLSAMYEHFRRQVEPGDVLTVTFYVQRS